MSESKLNNLIEKLQKYLEVESLMGKERIECSKSIFEDINESQKFILKGRKKSADIMFIREISQSDIDGSIEKNNSTLLKKIIEALKYSEEQVLVMILEKCSHASTIYALYYPSSQIRTGWCPVSCQHSIWIGM